MNQKGFASVLGLCILSVMVFFGLAMLYLNQNEKSIVSGFAKGMQAQNLAESGAERAVLKLQQNKDLLREAQQASRAACIWESVDHGAVDQECRVYLTYDNEIYILMAVGTVAGSKGQIFVYLQPTEDGFTIEKWER